MVDPVQRGSGCCCGNGSRGEEPRRGFLAKSLALALGALAYATPAAVGIFAFLNPLRQKSQAGELMRLSSLEMLPEGGAPVKIPVITDRADAWNRFPNEPVGAVFLRRVAKDQVQAIQVLCPHAGCFVDYDDAKKCYVCPCHKATFDLDGKRREEKSESPRDLDTLEVELRGSEVWVIFQKFQVGTPEKKPRA
jgi:menaquinol-cytochrome c reductase iron-sulfur subunit